MVVVRQQEECFALFAVDVALPVMPTGKHDTEVKVRRVFCFFFWSVLRGVLFVLNGANHYTA